jgi:hypothetical protein
VCEARLPSRPYQIGPSRALAHVVHTTELAGRAHDHSSLMSCNSPCCTSSGVHRHDQEQSVRFVAPDGSIADQNACISRHRPPFSWFISASLYKLRERGTTIMCFAFPRFSALFRNTSKERACAESIAQHVPAASPLSRVSPPLSIEHLLLHARHQNACAP